MVQSKPRERLIETSLRLFSTNGFHATGIDRILAEAGVAKMTLYRHFRSKDELILATLDRYELIFRSWLEGVLRHSDLPADKRILDLFDKLSAWFVGTTLGELTFQGSMLTNAAAEFGQPNHPIHDAVADHVRRLSGILEETLHDAGLPPDLANRLVVLMLGGVLLAQIYRDPQVFSDARKTAKSILLENVPV
ncbi:TetR/AcrR family transcriptional regulator [Rhodospirillum sp. A1_3_36]|uniref:TetR/AcrR family transcriptional regulator n=1 Tax=Rhodospirillum sp. A1_3_36 TaxID=3391666 RepID=UPI0039A70344